MTNLGMGGGERSFATANDTPPFAKGAKNGVPGVVAVRAEKQILRFAKDDIKKEKDERLGGLR
jgi:hypothetical protein